MSNVAMSRNIWQKRQEMGSPHEMRNEIYLRLRWLHRAVQCSCFFPVRDQKYLCLLETEEQCRTLSSQFIDELPSRCASRGFSERFGGGCLLQRPRVSSGTLLERRSGLSEPHEMSGTGVRNPRHLRKFFKCLINS